MNRVVAVCRFRYICPSSSCSCRWKMMRVHGSANVPPPHLYTAIAHTTRHPETRPGEKGRACVQPTRALQL